jgi:ankyrin repeat protein
MICEELADNPRSLFRCALVNSALTPIALRYLYDGWTPLNIASVKGDIETVRLLLSRDADITVRNRYGWSASALEAAARGGSVEVFSLLLQNGADPHGAGFDSENSLNLASIYGSLGIVELLLREQPRDFLTEEWEAALLSASQFGHVAVVTALLDAGVDIEAEEYGYGSPLFHASNYGHVEVATLLLDRGADAMARAFNGRRNQTPLYAASQHGHIKVVKLLLERGANVAAGDSFSRSTPLHAASEIGHVQVARLLLEWGADLTALDRSSRTPLGAASSYGEVGTARLLLEKGANVLEGDTFPLASKLDRLGVNQLLLEWGWQSNETQ